MTFSYIEILTYKRKYLIEIIVTGNSFLINFVIHSHTHARYHELPYKRQLSYVKKWHVKRSRYSKPFPEKKKKIISKKNFPERQDNQNYKLRMDKPVSHLRTKANFDFHTCRRGEKKIKWYDDKFSLAPILRHMKKKYPKLTNKQFAPSHVPTCFLLWEVKALSSSRFIIT